MPEEDPCQSWLEEFRKEVDAVLGAPGASLPVASKAQADFSAWWDNADQEPRAADSPSDRDAFARQKAGWEAELKKKQQENDQLRRKLTAFQQAILEIESTIASSRQNYESAIERLQAAPAHESQKDKQELVQELRRQLRSLQEQLRQQRGVRP